MWQHWVQRLQAAALLLQFVPACAAPYVRLVHTCLACSSMQRSARMLLPSCYMNIPESQACG